MKACIIIPAYKQQLSKDEEASLKQCIKILPAYDIILIHPQEMSLENYYKAVGDFHFNKIAFSADYFSTVNDYNRLMLSPDFYQQFSAYDYLLIYQLDAFVFKDELMDWCHKGYDYIGAPWFENYATDNKSEKIWSVGNGGFSLRKIDRFIDVLKSDAKLTSKNHILKEYRSLSWGQIFKKFPVYANQFLNITNNTKDFLRHFILNEDYFWGNYLKNSYYTFKVPEPEVALQFSFESHPDILYEKNNRQLPFGCHGWRKYDWDFWRPFFVQQGYDL